MDKEKALKNQGLEFREDIVVWGGIIDSQNNKITKCGLDVYVQFNVIR